MRAITLPAARETTLEVATDVVGTLRRHRLATHATALAFRVLTSLVPLALLGIGVLRALGLQSVWTESIAPTLHRHLAPSAAAAADEVARGIFERSGLGLLALASLMVLWNTFRATSEVERALDEIHERELQERPLVETLARRLALAVVVDLCLVSALLSFVVAPRIVHAGTAHLALEALRWVLAVGLLWAAVTARFRYAPLERPEASWASGGSALVVGTWLVASVLFGFWSTSVANYRTGVGTLTAFLVLTAYTLVVSYVFVLGAQLDETLRRRNEAGGARSAPEGVSRDSQPGNAVPTNVQGRERTMGISLSILLIAIGAILAWAVNAEVAGIDIQVAGVILVVVGVIGLIVSLVFWSSWGGFGNRDTAAGGGGQNTTVVDR